MALLNRIRAAEVARSANVRPASVLVVGESVPHTHTVVREPVWLLRSKGRAMRDGRSPWSADAPISGGPSL